MAAGEGFTMRATVDTKQAQASLNQINARLEKTNKLLMAIHSQSRQASGSLGKVGGGATKAGGAFGNLGSSIKGTMMQFIGLQAIMQFAIASLKQVLTWAMNTKEAFRAFEQSMAEVSTILQDVSLKQLPALTAGVEVASKTFGKSAVDMSRAMYQILSAAFEASEAMGLLNVAVKASVAGLTTVEKSVDVITSVLNSYGKAASQATQVSDVLFQTVIRGKLRFEDLASAMGYITPIAAAAGVAFEEVAAALSTVTRMGLHVDMASRGLALLIQGIVSPTQQASDAAEEYGVNMDALSLRIGGLKGFIEDLNEAASEFGTNIIPQIVRNMRSLRVVMALASEEGLQGFIKDLGLVENAAGKTDEALAKMMNTAQTQANILEQGMQDLERSIGDAWSGFDIWWKKAQLWWGTLFSGGDADKAVQDIEDRFDEIKLSYSNMLEATARLERQKPLFTQLMAEVDTTNFDEIIAKAVDFKRVKEFLDISLETSEFSENLSAMQIDAGKLDVVAIEFKNMHSDLYKMVGGSSQLIDDLNNKFKELGVDFEIAVPKGGGDIYLMNILSQIETEAQNFRNEMKTGIGTLETYQTSIADLQPDFAELTAGLASASEAIFNYRRNISELEGAMKILRQEVEDTYTTLDGQQFEGQLGWTIELATQETELARATQFSNMAMKYGAEYINDYNNDMKSQILTIYNYEEAQKAATEATNKYNDALDQNRLKMMKIQLMGMRRRRGLTRNEQKQLKQLEIEGLELRIADHEKAIVEKNAIDEEGNAVARSLYEQAKFDMQRYSDEQQHNIFMLSDIRNDEIRELQESYDEKKEDLAGYIEDHKEQYELLGKTYEAQLAMLESFNPEIAQQYHDLYAISIPESINATLEAYAKLYEASGGLLGAKVELTQTKAFGGMPTYGWSVAQAEKLSNTSLKVTSTSGKEKVFDYGNHMDMFKDLTGKYKQGNLIEWKRGVEYVPETGIAMLHRGERVSPANANNTGGNTFYINIPIKAEIKNDYDITKLASELGATLQAQLTDSTGKTKYRMR